MCILTDDVSLSITDTFETQYQLLRFQQRFQMPSDYYWQETRAVETYRWLFKPKKIKLLLIAESYAFWGNQIPPNNQIENWRIEDQENTEFGEFYRNKKHRLEQDLDNFPLFKTKFIYDLTYEETGQFWQIFRTVVDPTDDNLGMVVAGGGANANPERTEKWEILYQMEQKGIWLVDYSLLPINGVGNDNLRASLVNKWRDNYPASIGRMSDYIYNPHIPKLFIGIETKNAFKANGLGFSETTQNAEGNQQNDANNYYVYQPQGIRRNPQKRQELIGINTTLWNNFIARLFE